MKKLIFGLAVYAVAAIALTGGNSARADWEYVHSGIVCVGGNYSPAATIEAELNERIHANPREFVFTTTTGHKKVAAPYRIVNVSVSNADGVVRACATVEARTP